MNNKQEKITQWHNLKRIYAIMFRYWGLVVGGIITMLFYALMNGISITMIVPILDVVLKPNTNIHTILTLNDLLTALSARFDLFINNQFDVFNLRTIGQSGFLNDLKIILLATKPFVVLIAISIFVVLLFLTKNLFFYLNKIMFTNLRGRLVRDIRNLMYSKYLSQSLSFFNQNRVGDSQVRLDNDVTIVSNEFISNLFVVLRDFFVMLSCMIVAYFMNPRLFLISLIVTPIFTISISYIGKK